MKKIYILLLFVIASYTNVFSQTITDIATGLETIYSAELHGNDLYFTQFEGKLSKIDLTDASFNVVDVLTGLDGPIPIKLKGDDLYMGLARDSTIVKIDLTDSTLATVDVVTNNVGGLIDMHFYNDELYWVEGNLGKRIAKINLTDSTPTVVNVLTGIYFAGMDILGDELYFSNTNDHKIQKIDLTAAIPTVVDVVVTDLDYPKGITFIGNKLYIANGFGNDVLVADVSQTLPVTTTQLFLRSGIPSYLIFDSDNNYMYLTELNGVIARFNIFSVSVNDILTNPVWTIFPNPAQDLIQFKGLQKEQAFQIFNSIGRLVQEGIAIPDKVLSIDKLKSGIYFLRLENGDLQEFIRY